MSDLTPGGREANRRLAAALTYARAIAVLLALVGGVMVVEALRLAPALRYLLPPLLGGADSALTRLAGIAAFCVAAGVALLAALTREMVRSLREARVLAAEGLA